MRIKYEGDAKQDLADIRQHYLDVGGNALALRMVRSIRTEASILADNPNIGSVYDLVHGLRRLVVAKGAFLVFYRVMDRVQVVHIRRAEREPVGADSLGEAV